MTPNVRKIRRCKMSRLDTFFARNFFDQIKHIRHFSDFCRHQINYRAQRRSIASNGTTLFYMFYTIYTVKIPTFTSLRLLRLCILCVKTRVAPLYTAKKLRPWDVWDAWDGWDDNSDNSQNLALLDSRQPLQPNSSTH